MKQEYKITFAKGYNWCIPEGYTIYNALDENDLGDFVNFCDNITEIEDAIYEINLIFTDKRESHEDWIELTREENITRYIILDSNYKGNEHLDLSLLCKECSIDSTKYIYAKATYIPDEPKEEHPPIVEGKVYSLDFRYQDNWVIDTVPFKGLGLSSFATIDEIFAIIAKDKQPFTLDIICTKKREIHEGWIELYENSGFTYQLSVSNLEGYKGICPIFLSSRVIDVIGFYPKYIYIKKYESKGVSNSILHRLLKIFRK